MTINFGDLSRGMVIELDNQPWQIMDYERHKMQQRAPVTRIKMKNLLSGAVVERTFQRYDTVFTQADSRSGASVTVASGQRFRISAKAASSPVSDTSASPQMPLSVPITSIFPNGPSNQPQ